MFMVHEGLPRSGKSYEAMVKHVLPALAKGRKVFAFIDGIDHQKIAEVTGMDLEHVQALLVPLTKEQLPNVQDHVEDRSLVVLDEMQDTWPTGRQKLDPGITEFVTQHGHREIDILGMTQDIKDIHSLWRRRADKKIQFVKRDVLGKPNEYTWRTYKQTRPDRWEEIMSGKGKYDPKYFGIYKSHSTDNPEGEDYKDDRAVIWKRKGIRYGIPLVILVAILGANYVWNYFHPKLNYATKQQNAIASVSHIQATAQPLQAKPVKLEAKKEITGYGRSPGSVRVWRWSTAKPRLEGVIIGAKKIEGLVQVLEPGSYRQLERLTFTQLRNLGWHVWIDEQGSMAMLRRGDKLVTVTTWPVEPLAKDSAAQNASGQRQRKSGLRYLDPEAIRWLKRINLSASWISATMVIINFAGLQYVDVCF